MTGEGGEPSLSRTALPTPGMLLTLGEISTYHSSQNSLSLCFTDSVLWAGSVIELQYLFVCGGV